MGYYVRHLLPALETEISSNSAYSHFRLLTFSSQKPLSQKADFLHIPYFQPFFPSIYPTPSLPFVVTVPDLIPLELPHLFPVGLKGKWNWWLQKRRLLQAKYIITISHYSKYSIVQHTGFPSDRIYSAWLGPTVQKAPIPGQKTLTAIKAKYHLPDKFVLYVGAINTNKNIPLLVTACQKLGYPLVIAGSDAVKTNVPLHPWTKDLLWLQSHLPGVQCLGFVPDVDLPYLYSLATLYCQPSLSEGFGLNVVDAMACGCPVVYALNSALIEVMDYQGQFFDANSLDSLSIALTSVWKSPVLRRKLTKAGLKRAQIFSWRQTALQTLAVYQQLANEIH
jgi:glycosyltransferase involved in cell wall biosynthesis